MQLRRHTSAKMRSRRGFTLIELLVVISIIATLMSLILPAVQNAREAGRRTQCLNNIRNVSLAALNFASAHKSRLPALGYYPLGDDDNDSMTAEVEIHGRSWAVELLPYLDEQATYDRWDKASPWYDTLPADQNNLDLGDLLSVAAFACPNDDSAFQQDGGLSYVANAGYSDATTPAGFDNITSGTDASASAPSVEHSFVVEAFQWDDTVGAGDPTDLEVNKSTGVFWSEFSSESSTRNQSASVGKIYDGTGNTLMFGENTKAGFTNWADPNPNNCAFTLPLDVTAVDGDTLLAAATDVLSTVSPFPNESRTEPEGEAPYLNSDHPGIVVVSFCDGSAKSLSDSIDQGVYVRLMTPNGTRQRSDVTEAENPVSSTSF